MTNTITTALDNLHPQAEFYLGIIFILIGTTIYFASHPTGTDLVAITTAITVVAVPLLIHAIHRLHHNN